MTSEDDTGQVVVQLTTVRKEYGDSIALDGVSLEIRAGEAVAVMGPSGSGKSTLLNLVAGLDRPTAGSVVVHGDDLGKLNERGLALYRRRRIGMIFQFFNLLDDLPALDNVALAAQLTGVSAAQARKRALELLDELGVADRKNIYPAQLSGGERQRVAVARALMNRPALLLADEPTGALGQPGRRAGDGPAARPQPDRPDAADGDARRAARHPVRQPPDRGRRRTGRARAQPGAHTVSARSELASPAARAEVAP